MSTSIERVSIELSNRCSKGCAFCYNASAVGGGIAWDAASLVAFGRDLVRHGTRALSFGGGEPLETPDLLYAALDGLRGVAFRSFTTNGLLLDEHLERVVAAAPDKVHISIHAVDRRREVDRVVAQVAALAARGIRSGVNLLVRRSQLDDAAAAARALHDAGIGNERIVYLPMRGEEADMPSPAEVARVAGGNFQSMTCLARCAASPRFASVSWDRQAAWCSYTSARRPLASVDHAGLVAALDGLGVTYCGTTAPIALGRSRSATV